jgi:hypothetical protein
MKTKLTTNFTTKVVCDNRPMLENILRKKLIINFGDLKKGVKKRLIHLFFKEEKQR